jgi:transposase
MNTGVTLTSKELKRLKVLSDVDAHAMTAQQGADMLELSLRHVRRLLRAYRLQGAAALAHGNRGRPSPRRIAQAIRDKVLALTEQHYRDYNDHHLTEVLAEDHAIHISRSSLRRLRRQAGLGTPRKHRPPKHRSRRERYPRSGMFLQIDGSRHDWLENRGPRLSLIAAIDDATSQVVAALFREQEDAAGYFLLLRQICQTHGLPLALYADQHTIFQSPKQPTLAQELAGTPPRSQFGRLVDELHIRLIPALSPQAKGRIERLFGTLQDRLVKALRRAGAHTLEEANRLLLDFLPHFNSRFARLPPQPGSAYLPWPTGLPPQDVFCFKYLRTVSNDNTLSFAGHVLPIPPGPHLRSYARRQVELHHDLEGRLVICYQDHHLVVYEPLKLGPPRVGKFTPARVPTPPPKPTTVRKPKPAPIPHKPAPDHPWRRPFIVSAKPSKSPG